MFRPAGLTLRAGADVTFCEPKRGLKGAKGAVNKLQSMLLPSLHHRKEGCLRHQENFAKPPKLTQTGWFSFCSHRKTTPSSRSADASRYFFDRSATPPCGDGGDARGVAPTVALRQFFHSPID